jgi:hypothetical protein
MKTMKLFISMAVVAIIGMLSVSIALADDFKTIDGKEYKNATVSRVESDGIVLKTKSGISKVYFGELPEDVARRFHSIEAGNGSASDAQRLATNEQEAASILTKAVEDFEAAEMRAAHAYKTATKGTLSGQVFVATKGRQNVKLGAMQVCLFDRDALDILLNGLYTFAAAKSQRLRLDLTAWATAEQAAKAAWEQAEATAIRNQQLYEQGAVLSDGLTAINVANGAAAQASDAYQSAKTRVQSLWGEVDYYHSYGFYFSYLRSPIATAETDAEGRFTIQVPRTGEYLICAQTDRMVWDETEVYYWLQPVSLEGQKERTVNLANNNLYLRLTPTLENGRPPQRR